MSKLNERCSSEQCISEEKLNNLELTVDEVSNNVAMTREQRIADIRNSACWDIVIVGGGITGAGILKLASQMLAPLSVEKRVAKLVRQSSKAVRSGRTKILDAKNSLDEAISLLEEEISWRSRASSNLLPSLQKYRASIANTIGVRRLPDLPKAVARELITCSASPPDLSLRF